jgi:hypothetical protein
MIGLTVAMLIGLGVLLVGTLLLAKAVLWLVLLPFRLLFGLIFGVLVLPFVLLKLILGALLLLVVGPVLVIAFLAAAVAAVAAITVPLLPFLCIGFVIWVVLRGSSAVTA